MGVVPINLAMLLALVRAAFLSKRNRKGHLDVFKSLLRDLGTCFPLILEMTIHSPLEVSALNIYFLHQPGWEIPISPWGMLYDTRPCILIVRVRAHTHTIEFCVCVCMLNMTQG